MIEIHPLPVFLVLTIAFIIFRAIRIARNGISSIWRELVVILLFAYLCGVFYLTFFPLAVVLYNFDPMESNLVPFQETFHMLSHLTAPGVIRNVAGNLVMLLPLGIFVPLLFPKMRKFLPMLLLAFWVSFLIEIVQFLMKFRIFDVDDLILNTLGALIGFGIFSLLARIPAIQVWIKQRFNSGRPKQILSILVFAILAASAFFGLYAAKIIEQTQTKAQIQQVSSAAQERILGQVQFGEYLFSLAEKADGTQFLVNYRQIYFNRYVLFSKSDPFRLPDSKYSVSGIAFDKNMNYFIAAHPGVEVNRVVSNSDMLPIQTIGEYVFSYGYFPMVEDRFSTFRFLDSNGNEIPMKMCDGDC